jgi:hypothetical protein
MSDALPSKELVTKLRSYSEGSGYSRFMRQAADEIELLEQRLKAAHDRLHQVLSTAHEPCAEPHVVKCSRGGDMTADDIDAMIEPLCGNVKGNVTDHDLLYRAQVALLHLVKLMRAAPPPRVGPDDQLLKAILFCMKVDQDSRIRTDWRHLIEMTEKRLGLTKCEGR